MGGLGLNVRRGVEAELFQLRQADGGQVALAAARDMDSFFDAAGQYHWTLPQLVLEAAAAKLVWQ